MADEGSDGEFHEGDYKEGCEELGSCWEVDEEG